MSLLPPSRAPVLLALPCLALLACSSRTLDSDSNGTSGGGDDVSSATMTTGVPTTGEPPSTGGTATVSTTSPATATSEPPDDTTTTTTDPTATATATVGPTSADPSLPGTATDDLPPKFDMGVEWVNVPEGLWQGCFKDAPPGTAVQGQSGFGPFASARAYFGYTEVNGLISGVHLFFLGDGADAELAFAEMADNFGGDIVTGPGADVEPTQLFTAQNQFWVGQDSGAVLEVVLGGKKSMVSAVVNITGHSGTWDVADPDDPPRLQGNLEAAGDGDSITGTFDAVLCDLLSQHIIAE